MSTIITNPQDFNQEALTNLPAPVNDGDAATKKYVDDNAGDGGGSTLYTGDGALTGNRNVDLADNKLSFQYDGIDLFVLDPTDGNEKFYLTAWNPTSISYSRIVGNTLESSSNLVIQALFNDGEQNSSITLNADEGSKNIDYSADTHTFNGKIIIPGIVAKNFADDAAAEIGGVEIGEDYHTDGVKKVRII